MMRRKPIAGQSAELTELLRSVDAMRPFVRYRLQGRPADVDAVLQSVREVVWRKSWTFDANRGTPSAFVFGITRNVVRRELAKRVTPTEELPAELEAVRMPDPLSGMVRRFDAQRWMGLVAEFVGESDWGVITDFALGGRDKSTIAAEHRLTPSRLRSIRDRVGLTASTVRAALAVVDADVPVTDSVVLGCVPERGGLRAVARMLEADSGTIAAALRIHPGSARARIATARRLLSVATTVIRQEYAA